MKGLFSSLASFGERALALFHRGNQLKVESDDRKQRWNQVIAEYKKPLEQGKAAGKTEVSPS